MTRIFMLILLASAGNAQEPMRATMVHSIPNNILPGVIIMWPVPDNSQEHMRLAASFMVTGNLPAGTRLVATATLPTGDLILLRNFLPDGCFVKYSFTLPGPSAKTLTPDSCSPTSYPLTGSGLPVASLPVGTVVEVAITPASQRVRPYHVSTTASIRGIEQSGSRLQLQISGTFQPNLPAYVYFGFWPVPLRPEAVTVSADRVLIDFDNDHDARRWTSDLYPITVFQPGAVCDSVLARFRSPLGGN